MSAGPGLSKEEVLRLGVARRTPESAARIGRQLAGQFELHGYHPVLVFGAADAGKSALLASLLAALKLDPQLRVTVELGEPLALDDADYGRWARAESVAVFRRGVQQFLAGMAPASTDPAQPFFVPVVLKPHGGLPEARFAFLEGSGAWYQPRPDTPDFFQPLKEEIAGVLRHFQQGISVLHVAPCDAGGETASLGLVGAIEAYAAVRTQRALDAHLFVLAKSDLAAPVAGEDAAPDFVAISRLAHRQGFAALRNLDLGSAPERKQLLPYSAGVFSGRELLRPTEADRAWLEQCPRVLWNWLYRNATRDAGGERELFALPPPRPTLGARLDRIVARALRLIGV